MNATAAAFATATTHAFARSAEILLELQNLFKSNRLSSPESHRLSDESLPLWNALDEQQQEILDGLSEDLNSFTDDEVPRQAENPQFVDAERQSHPFVHAGDWAAVLEHCRRWRNYIDPAVLAHRRCWAWRQARLPQIGLAFADFAQKLAPEQPPTGWMRMETLAEVDPTAPLREFQRATDEPEEFSVGELMWLAADARHDVERVSRAMMVTLAALDLAKTIQLPAKLRKEWLDAAAKLAHDIISNLRNSGSELPNETSGANGESAVHELFSPTQLSRFSMNLAA